MMTMSCCDSVTKAERARLRFVGNPARTGLHEYMFTQDGRIALCLAASVLRRLPSDCTDSALSVALALA